MHLRLHRSSIGDDRGRQGIGVHGESYGKRVAIPVPIFDPCSGEHEGPLRESGSPSPTRVKLGKRRQGKARSSSSSAVRAEPFFSFPVDQSAVFFIFLRDNSPPFTFTALFQNMLRKEVPRGGTGEKEVTQQNGNRKMQTSLKENQGRRD